MTQWVKVLVQHVDLCSDPQQPHKKLGMMTCICNPNVVGTEACRSQILAN